MSQLGDLAVYIAVLSALVFASGFFSGSEVALFSLRRVDREQMARSRRAADAAVLWLMARPRRLIATLLLGNEFVNVSISAVLARMSPALYPDRSEFALALLATFTALPVVLLLGEITPKTIAIESSVSWSRAVARPLRLFSMLVTPIRFVVLLLADLILRPLGGSTRQGMLRDLSEEEFRTLVDAGSAEGVVDARERRLIHRVFEFGDKTVAQVMAPRGQIFALSYDLPRSRLIAEVARSGYSRVPIYLQSLDDVRGILYAKDLIVHGVGRSPRGRLHDLLHEPLFVPDKLPLERLFRIFKKRKTHMALVVDEYGMLTGLVTMDDLLEELFGEIRDEREQQKAARLTTDRGSPSPDDGGGSPSPDHGGDSPPPDHGGDSPPPDHGGSPSPDHGGSPSPEDGGPAAPPPASSPDPDAEEAP